jgi:hypothetical protein
LKYILLAPNQQSLDNLLPIAEELSGKNHTTIFMNLDKLYKQNTGVMLHNFETLEFNVALPQAFYYLSLPHKLLALFNISREIKQIDDFDGVIIGSMGTAEYLIAKHLKEKYGAKVYLIQDSILFRAEAKGKLSKIRNFISGGTNRKNICEKIFVSGEATKEVLIKDGIDSAKLIASGIPRFRYIFQKIINVENKEVLFISSAFKWHSTNDILERKQIEIVKKLELVCKDNDLQLTVRIHPRLFLKPECTYAEVQNSDIPLKQALNEHKYIVSAHTVSTVLLESLWLKKKVIFIDESEMSDWDIKYLKESLIWTRIQNISDALTEGENEYQYSDYFITKKTPNSVNKILCEILES